jgi:hypothetical protein
MQFTVLFGLAALPLILTYKAHQPGSHYIGYMQWLQKREGQCMGLRHEFKHQFRIFTMMLSLLIIDAINEKNSIVPILLLPVLDHGAI